MYVIGSPQPHLSLKTNGLCQCYNCPCSQETSDPEGSLEKSFLYEHVSASPYQDWIFEMVWILIVCSIYTPVLAVVFFRSPLWQQVDTCTTVLLTQTRLLQRQINFDAVLQTQYKSLVIFHFEDKSALLWPQGCYNFYLRFEYWYFQGIVSKWEMPRDNTTREDYCSPWMWIVI